jgi:hypothetical protein
MSLTPPTFLDERSASERGGLTARDCVSCRHLRGFEPPVCAAFPQGIPAAVASGELSHRAPIAGDNGLRFDEMTEDEISDAMIAATQ